MSVVLVGMATASGLGANVPRGGPAFLPSEPASDANTSESQSDSLGTVATSEAFDWMDNLAGVIMATLAGLPPVLLLPAFSGVPLLLIGWYLGMGSLRLLLIGCCCGEEAVGEGEAGKGTNEKVPS